MRMTETSREPWCNRRTISEAVAIAVLAMATAACEPGSFGPEPTSTDVAANPTASIMPRPLDEPAAPLGDAGAGKEGRGDAATDAAPPPPEPIAPLEQLPADRIDLPFLSGVTLNARWRWSDEPAPAGVPQSNEAAISEAREQTNHAVVIQLAAMGRMRMDMASRALPLPKGSAVLARSDRYGSLVVWPDGLRYRVVAPGALRTTFGEGRVDVSPLTPGTVEQLGTGEIHGYATRKVRARSALGSVTLEVAAVPEAGAGGPLLCRFLVEIADIEPNNRACQAGEVVLSAQYSWGRGETERPGIALQIDSVARQTDLSAQRFEVPPRGARYLAAGMPQATQATFFSDSELSSLRKEASAPPTPPDPAALESGLLALNNSDMQMYLLLDGVPVASVAPWKQLHLQGPKLGRYNVQWRSFLGDVVGDSVEKDLPARVIHGEQPETEEADAGK